MENNETRNDRLAPLSGLKDYKIAKDNPDILGWRLIGADGESLGVVKDLIVDVKAMKARYLSVVADRKYFNTGGDQYILIPIGAAALDKKGRKVFVTSLDAGNISRYPVYPGGPIPGDYEYAVRDAYHRSSREAIADEDTYKEEFEEALHHRPEREHHAVPDDFYNDESYNEDRFYTSSPDTHRDRPHPERTYQNQEYSSYSAADLHSEERRPKSVEDSIATIERLEDLRERGSITEEEFILLKKRALDL